MTKKIIQISPFPFSHLGGVEKYAEILEKIFSFSEEKSIPNIIPSPSRRGETSGLRSEAEQKGSRGEVIFQTIEAGKDFRIFEPVANCSVPNFFDKNFYKIFSHISRENTKILISHIRFSPVTWFVFCFAKAKKIPYIHIEHGSGHLIHKNFLIEKVAKIVDMTIGKYILKNADFVISVSKNGENWVKNFAKRNEKIETIYRGFDIFHQKNSGEKPYNKLPSPMRRGTGSEVIIGFVGRLVPLKNLEILLKVLKNFEKKFDWKLQIIGDGEMRGEWENLAKNLGITHRVAFLGAKDNAWILENFLPNIDIFVNPSLQEGLPTSVIEAKISDCEVLATNVGGTSEIPDITLCEPTEISLGKNLEKIFEKILKNNAKTELSEDFLQKFSLEKMRENYLKIFEKM